MQQTQRNMQLLVEGPTTKKLIQEVHKVEKYSTTELQVFSELRQKVEQPAEWLKAESRSLCWGPIGMGSLGLELNKLVNFVKDVKSSWNVHVERADR